MRTSRVAVLAEDALDEHAQLRTDVVANRPVDRDVLANRLDELPRDRAQRVVTEDLDRAVVGFQRVVERELIVGESELLASRSGCAHILRELDQLLDHLRGLASRIPRPACRIRMRALSGNRRVRRAGGCRTPKRKQRR
jgi:hypothetical protein